ncbi:unnamed protein product [Staurois parvus]|uniref:Uncharacterized protein n=1 Tax=Staurois parvus TaxID=386267 RepID=A0ABN9A7F8_9NEOB|nr:unnamed protein product [Staurois parvus]
MISVVPSVPPVSVHQCHISVPVSAAYECCQSVLPINASQYCLSVPISDACQYQSVPPHQCPSLQPH